MRLPISDKAGEALAWGRIAAGTAAWLFPGLGARVMGLQPTPANALGLRLFGSRDVAVGVGYLQSGPAERDRWLLLGMGVDGADAVAGLIAGKRHAVPWPRALVIAATATAAVVTAREVRSRG